MKIFYNERLGLYETKCPLCGLRCIGNVYWDEFKNRLSDVVCFRCDECPVATARGAVNPAKQYWFEVKRDCQTELFG